MLPTQGKILALDLGTRRTGVAVSDIKQSIAFARPEIEHQTNDELFEVLKILVTKEGIVGLLLGRPVKLDGEETEQTHLVENTAERLKELNIPAEFTDERLSTQFAKNLYGFQTKGKHVDSRSAQILLETYLLTASRSLN